MSVEAVNSVQNVAKPIQNNKDTQPQKTEEKQSMTNETKLLLGSLAALAIGGVIYVLTKGKGNKDVLNRTSTPTETIKEYSIKAFKDAGNKFEKGKAKLANGENYTGTITCTTKDGSRFVIEYKDGFLQKSTKFNGKEQIFNKVYFYDEFGNLSKIESNNKTIYEVLNKDNIRTVKTSNTNFVIDNTIGKIVLLQQNGKGIKNFFYTKDGVLKYIDHQFSGAGISGIREVTKFAPDGKTRLFTIRSSQSAKFFDKEGKVIDEIQIDLLRNGNTYYYKDLSYRNDVMTASKEYQLFSSETKSPVILTQVDKSNFKANSLHLSFDNTRYTIDLDTNEIYYNSGQKITDKNLSERIIAEKTKILAEINNKHEQAMSIKSQLQEALNEVDKSGSRHLV